MQNNMAKEITNIGEEFFIEKRRKLTETIKSFSKLKNNWDTYGALPLRPELIQKALWFLNLIPDIDLINLSVVPCADETINFEWHTMDEYFYANIFVEKNKIIQSKTS